MEEKIQELITLLKTKKKDMDRDKVKKTLTNVLLVAGICVGVVGLIYALYKYFRPDYLEDDEDGDYDEDESMFEE